MRSKWSSMVAEVSPKVMMMMLGEEADVCLVVAADWDPKAALIFRRVLANLS